MLYTTRDEWLQAPRKRILFFGMSGLGKTYLASMLRASGEWFHYSVDYRIGTRYMGELIADNFKREAMKVPFLRELLLSDSVYIASNITFENLAPLSTYLGKPGSVTRGGLPFEEYMRRQGQHRSAEIAALLDTSHFIRRARELYNLGNFVCDSGGSVCEVVDPWAERDPVLDSLERDLLLVWIKGSADHTAELVRRFDRAPKPMYYQPDFLDRAWTDYRVEKGLREDQVNPDDFIRWTYARALEHRQPRYAAMARRGVTILAEEVAEVRTPADLIQLVGRAIDRKDA
ncbi:MULTISPECIES: ATPase [unclassified Paracoccus (in: a-proteobacteria)]|uniref:ATPase n=1 Tax=unclassified Paracoccus (in: a-proteobacteria) TaxID=2688777 RepID=UPI0012B33976|nr:MULTISPECIES: ATPase [unclassified Paracoccus (in: a-proteobacteria)]UXU74902.1 ATPase [Paracoccus sp. SMMA_5]UXU80804.1 ATPase [Paracoccus sp. SMMA_5_TC]